MEKCFKKQLKSVVNDDNLKVFDCFKMKVHIVNDLTNADQRGNRFWAVSSSPFKLKSSLDVYGFNQSTNKAGVNLGKEVLGIQSGDLYVIIVCFPKIGEYNLLVSSKYDFVEFRELSFYSEFDYQDFEYMAGLFKLQYTPNQYTAIKPIYLPISMQTLSLISTSFINEPSDINSSDFSHLTNVATLNLEGLPVIGNISDFGKLSSLSSFSLAVSPSRKDFIGNIEDFVVMAFADNSSKTITISYFNCQRTYYKGSRNNSGIRNFTLTWGPNAVNGAYTDISFNGVETTINITAQGNWAYVNSDKSKYTG